MHNRDSLPDSELAAHGNVFEDSRIDNLMWSKDTKQW